MASLALGIHAALLLWWHRMPDAYTTPAGVPAHVMQVQLGARSSQEASHTIATADRIKHALAGAPAQHPRPSELAYAVDDTRWRIRPDETAYLPASQLDQGPRLESEITLPFPEDETLPKGTRVDAVLVLYVSASGHVDRIEFGQSALPPAFARVAVESFARIHLRPGIKHGRPRRAMMKIEVEFVAPHSSRDFAGPVLESHRSWDAP